MFPLYTVANICRYIENKKIKEILNKLPNKSLSFKQKLLLLFIKNRWYLLLGIVFITTLNTKLNLKVESSLYMRKMSAIIYFTHFTLVYAFQFLFKIIGISLETNYTFEFVLCTISVIVYSHFIMTWKDGKNFLSGLY